MDGERGTIEIHLKELLEKAGLSKNKFCQRAELQRSQLNGYAIHWTALSQTCSNISHAKGTMPYKVYCSFILLQSPLSP